MSLAGPDKHTVEDKGGGKNHAYFRMPRARQQMWRRGGGVQATLPVLSAWRTYWGI